MKLDQIAKLSLENDLNSIATLPSPQNIELQSTGSNVLSNIMNRYGEMWVGLLTQQSSICEGKIVLEQIRNGQTIQLQGDLLYDRLLLSIATHYDFAIRNLLQQNPEKKVEIRKQIISLFRDLKEWSGEVGPRQKWSTEFSVWYFYLLGLIIDLEKAWPVDVFTRTFASVVEGQIHLSVQNLIQRHFHIQEIQPTNFLIIFSGILISKLLDFLKSTYDRLIHIEMGAWNPEHQVGAFSLINLRHLALLARRDPSMTHKFGEKQIEKVFEHQLALIFQSLGWHVVSTRTGERTVDLICVSAGSQPNASILVEAKTSKYPYSLPSKDERALIEYIEEVKRDLTSFPPLRFVLLIGWKASETLEKKLSKLEGVAQTPIRFCIAQDIADLRESIPGAAPLKALIDTILDGPKILPKGFTKGITERYNHEQNLHSDFVRGMLY